MINSRTCLWVPKVVSLTRVGGKGFKPIGKARCSGYREVWRCTTRVVRIVRNAATIGEERQITTGSTV